MISQQRSGPPSTQTVQADSDGICVRLPSWSTSVIISSKSAVRIYWTAKDMEEDRNSITLSGDDDDKEARYNATVCNVFVRGVGSQAEVTVTSIGIG